jgi:mono/diheme cytochrome c family protein
MKPFVLTLVVSAALWAQSANVENGKRLFETKACYQCHGWQGQGGLAGPRLAQTRLNLQGFRAAVRNPPPGGMPPYRPAMLSEQELVDVFAYVQSFPAPRPASEIPLLRDIR